VSSSRMAKRALVGLTTIALLVALLPGRALASSDDPLVRVSRSSPFAGCPSAGLDALLPTGEVEPVVVADPTDPDAAVTAWPQDRFRGIVAGVSADRGRTWRRVVVGGLTRCTGGTFDYADDLSLSVGSDGVVHLSAHVSDADRQRSGLLASRSADGGRTWSAPRALVVDPAGGNGEYAGGAITVDRADPRLVYGVVPFFAYPDSAGGAFRGTVAFARSRDGGRNWSAPRSILDTGDGRLTTGHQLAVLRGGVLVDVFTLLDLGADPRRPRLRVAVMRSEDRGRTWSQPAIVAEVRSVGVTDPETGDLVASGTRLQPAVAVDPAGGWVFVAWQDARFSQGQADAIALSWSRDGARTWSDPVKANATPTDVAAGNQQAFSPSLAAAADGTLGVGYSDFRFNDQGVALPTDRWLARCRPAAPPACGPPVRGETRLTASSFDMRQAHLLTEAGPPGFFLGDYQGLASAGSDFLAVFAQPYQHDPASVFARRVAARKSARD
jgi:BNR repeat-like domain